jgi:hypothetical protein
MQIIDIVIVIILVAILAFAIGFILKEKKRGKKCIGCLYADSCKSKSCASSNKEQGKD